MTTLRETRRQNLLDLVTEAGGQSALGALIGKERSQVWQWTLPKDDERGRGIGNTSARMIEDACKKPMGWLDADHTGKPKGSLVVVHPVRSLPDDVRPDSDTEREIETLEFELSAGNGKLVPTIVETRSPVTYRESWFRRMGYKPEKVKRVRVDGDSMEKTLFDGDYVVINTDDKNRVVDGRVYAIIYGADRHGRVKRLYRTTAGLRIVSDNPDKVRFPDELVEGDAADEVVIIGRVVDKSGSGGL